MTNLVATGTDAEADIRWQNGRREVLRMTNERSRECVN
jgi:hypothetical protein